jgi:hypothetical protein
MLDNVLADFRAEGIVALSHGRFRLRNPAPVVQESASEPIDDETFLAELAAMEL